MPTAIDPSTTLLNLVLVILLVFLNGFFVAAEFAMVKVRASRIDTLVNEGNRKASSAKTVIRNLDAYLSACQLGITLASLGLGWVGEPAIAKLLDSVLHGLLPSYILHTISFIIAFAIITFLHIVLGELAPKTLAIRKSEQVAIMTAPGLIIFRKIFSPFIWFLNGTANRILKWVGIEPASEHESAHTEEEIRILMKESAKSGFIDNNELKLFNNIFEFADTSAKEIMIPRTEMVCLFTDTPLSESQEIVQREMHTRYPVCEGDKDNVTGFVHVKDLLRPDIQISNITDLIRPIINVPESIQISALLKLMQKRRCQIAIIIDEYGGTAGMVTLEDIVEEIVGEIQDEFDEERPRIEKKDENTFSIDGLLHIDEVNDFFGLDIEEEDYDTIGGWIYSQIEIPPEKNKAIKYKDLCEFRIEETDHLRISRVLMRKLDKTVAPPAKND